jgi:hypothetical protein
MCDVTTSRQTFTPYSHPEPYDNGLEMVILDIKVVCNGLVNHSSLNHTHHSLMVILTEPWHRRSGENSYFQNTARRTPGLANIGMSGQTVRRRLCKSGIWARRPVVGPILKQHHRTVRLAWTRALNHTHRSLTVILTEPWHRRSGENSYFQNGKLFNFSDSTISVNIFY